MVLKAILNASTDEGERQTIEGQQPSPVGDTVTRLNCSRHATCVPTPEAVPLALMEMCLTLHPKWATLPLLTHALASVFSIGFPVIEIMSLFLTQRQFASLRIHSYFAVLLFSVPV